MHRRLTVPVGAIAVLLTWTAAADAVPVISISVGGTLASDPSGQVTSLVASGPFKGSLFVGSGAPFTGTLLEPQIDLSGVVKAAGAGTLVVKITQTGNTSPSPDWTFDSEFSDTLKTKGLTISYATFVDSTDLAFGTATLLSSTLVPFSKTGSLSDIVDVTIGSPFSITEIITLVSTGNSSLVSSFDASLSGIDSPVRVPEPATLSLLGAAVLGLGALARRRVR